MAIGGRTRKLLWGRAHNECAFPGCPQTLTEEIAKAGSDASDATVVGEEAHIRGQSVGGARYDPDYEDVDGYQNLMLMCPTHHTMIDANHGAGYSVDQLIEMKKRHEAKQSQRDGRQRALRAYLGDRFAAENSVQFQQVDLRGPSVDSMFVDVPIGSRPDDAAVADLFAEIVEASPGDSYELEAASGLIVAGATQVLLHPKWTGNAVLVGGPGQGKSTVLQFICQFHRARILGKDAYTAGRTGMARDATVGRFPIRIDLRRYAEWAAPSRDASKHGRRKRRGEMSAGSDWRSLEEYVVDHIRGHIGANKFDADDLASVIANEPVLLALDGLDEVASLQTRSRVIQEIALVRGRLTADAADLIILVATRPGGSLQPLTSSGFPVLYLQRLTQGLRLQYLHRWVTVSQLSADAAARLQATFMDSQHVAHINELASYPMQLAILLHLLHRRQLLPQQRTDLYREYLKTFLDREQTEDKEPLLDERRRVVEDTHAYLGWYLQAKAEQGDSSGAITRDELKRLLRSYLAGQPEEQELAEEIYSAITDRVLCLVERNDAFEFEVQSLREYFAALHMFENLTARGAGNSRDDGLDALLERPYWANVCRFFVGMLAKGEIRAFRGNLQSADRHAEPHPLVRGMAVLVLGDRIYNGQSDADIRKVVDFVLGGPGLILAEDGALDPAGSPLRFGDRAGRKQAVDHLRARMESDQPRPVMRATAASLAAHSAASDDSLNWWWTRFTPTPAWLETAAQLGALHAPDTLREEQLRILICSESGPSRWHVESLAEGSYGGSDEAILAAVQAEINDGAVDVLSAVPGTGRLAFKLSAALAAVAGRALPTPVPRPARGADPRSLEQYSPEVPSAFDLSRRLNAVTEQLGAGWVLRRAAGRVPGGIDFNELGAFITVDAVREAVDEEGAYREHRSDVDWWQSTLDAQTTSQDRALTVLAILRHARIEVVIKLAARVDEMVRALQPKHYRALEGALLTGHSVASTRRVNLDDAFRLKQIEVSGATLWLLWIVSTDAARSRIGRLLSGELADVLRVGVSDGRRPIEAARGDRKLRLEVFQGTRGVIPHGARMNPHALASLTPRQAKTMLREPENWPADLVQLAADRVAALSAKTTPPLADVAAKNKWFEPEG
ncbi:hypothetical protein D514_0118680 [Microbacterium sp. UCD-TDU]|nr:hypothetical protein D514_0118680 [Microbacterium sp. UCD-TDU]